MNVKKMNNEIKQTFEVYSTAYDITTIFEDTFLGEHLISTEVVGFYFGEPNEEATKQFYGKRKAEF